jgi:choline dehydrogenase
LAVEGFSVFLIEAGGDGSKDIAERIPSLYVSSNLVLCPTDTANGRAAETAPHSWQFFVEHFQNDTQARRDPKYAYRQTNGSSYVGLEPPAAAEP